MIDREKVIKGLECCTFILGRRKCNECPYQKGLPDNGCYQLQDDFHALLKEQEAVEPLAKEDDSYECICGAIVGWDKLDASGIVQTRFNYCPFCGKPISWEGR